MLMTRQRRFRVMTGRRIQVFYLTEVSVLMWVAAGTAWALAQPAGYPTPRLPVDLQQQEIFTIAFPAANLGGSLSLQAETRLVGKGNHPAHDLGHLDRVGNESAPLQLVFPGFKLWFDEGQNLPSRKGFQTRKDEAEGNE